MSIELTRSRFDDTNPEKEEEKYFIAIEQTIKWLGATFSLCMLGLNAQVLILLQASSHHP